MTTSYNMLSSTSIVGDAVRNPQGEDLGKIEDLMINTNDGQINYAVLSFGGILGMGGKYFAVPWSSLRVDREDKCLVLDVAKDRLENAPGFDKNQWPNFADPTFRKSVSDHYAMR